MKAFVTLSYGDRRALINTLRALRRKPGRAVMWALYATAILGFAVVKTGPWNHRRGGSPPPFGLALSDLWVCGLTIAFGVVLATGTARWLGVFSSRAEALVLMRADAAPVTVAAYLQLRTVFTTLTQGIARFAYLIVFGLPGGATFASLGAQLIFFGAAGAAVASVALPRALARGATRVAMIVTGWTIAVAATLPLIADALRMARFPGSAVLLHRVPALHPGSVLTALAAGDLRAVVFPIAIAACATAAFAYAARDAYPELYTISLANLDWRERARTRRGRRGADESAPRVKNARSAMRTRLRGAFAFVWIDALMFGRRVSPPIAALVAAVALSAGAGLAALAHGRNGDTVVGIMFGAAPANGDKVFGMIFFAAPALYITVASTVAVRLAPVLRLPLFWLGEVPLVARLAAWTFGGFWRDALIVALAVAGYVAIAHEVLVPLTVFVAALGLLALSRTVGLAVFAMLPNALDQRGPGVVLRVWLCFLLLVPAVVAGTIASFVSHFSIGAGTTAATITAFAESALLLEFAAWRLAGRVDNLALS